MTDTAEHLRCPVCNGEMLAKDDQPFCPVCLMQQGMNASSMGGFSALQNWTPPQIDELVDRFPNLHIESLIGQGGMGAVYKVRQKELDRPAALKVLPQAVASDPSFTERFLREARLLASLSHPHIVTVYEFGQRDGFYFILMEYVDGVTLRQASLAEPIKRLAPKEGLAVVGQLCDALQFAHDEGVVHRDIKPENILIDKRGRVKIADFGLAKLLGKPADLPTLTRTHQLMGTPAYMAPEQVEGQPVIDHRADIYSLGVVFYELLTGELPLGRFQPPSAKAELDARLDEVVFRTLEKEPGRRYQQASEVRTDVDAIRTGVAAPSAGAPLGGGIRIPWLAVRILLMIAAFWVTFELQGDNLDAGFQAPLVAFWVGMLLEALRPERGLFKSKWSKAAVGTLFGVIVPILVVFAWKSQIDKAINGALSHAKNSVERATAAERNTRQQLSDARAKLDELEGEARAGGPGMGMDSYGGSGGGPGLGSYEAGGGGYEFEMMVGGGYEGGMGGLGDDMGMGTMSAGPPPPAIEFAGRTPKLTGMPDLKDGKRDVVNEILADIHQKYLKLEAEHSIVTLTETGTMQTAVFTFTKLWQQLEDELWTRLDDTVDVEQQRLLRNYVAVTNYSPQSSNQQFDGNGYPEQGTDTMPGLLGWYSLRMTQPNSAVAASIQIRRKGRWFEWKLSGDDSFQRGPELPDVIQRFYREPGPWMAVLNARAAYNMNAWATLANCFTHTGRFDWARAVSQSSTFDDLFAPSQPRNWLEPAFQGTAAAFRGFCRLTDVEYRQSNADPSWSAKVREICIAVVAANSENERREVLLAEVPKLPIVGSAYYFLQVALAQRIQLDKGGPSFILARDAELVCDAPNGDSAEGFLKFPDGSEAPIRFRFVDNEWKIDAILTPETSLILAEPSETPKPEDVPAAPQNPDHEDLTAP